MFDRFSQPVIKLISRDCLEILLWTPGYSLSPCWEFFIIKSYTFANDPLHKVKTCFSWVTRSVGKWNIVNIVFWAQFVYTVLHRTIEKQNDNCQLSLEAHCPRFLKFSKFTYKTGQQYTREHRCRFKDKLRSSTDFV